LPRGRPFLGDRPTRHPASRVEDRSWKNGTLLDIHRRTPLGFNDLGRWSVKPLSGLSFAARLAATPSGSRERIGRPRERAVARYPSHPFAEGGVSHSGRIRSPGAAGLRRYDQLRPGRARRAENGRLRHHRGSETPALTLSSPRGHGREKITVWLKRKEQQNHLGLGHGG
jgi:hypothetical protein